MSEYVLSLKRLYMNSKITADYINARESLTEEEKAYILSDEPIIAETYENAYNILVTGEVA